jgi:exonuclease SbcD
MPATLVVGDIHLGKGLNIGKTGIGSSLNSRILDQYKLCDWILDVAHERNVTSVILTGDIFEDAKPDYVLVDFFLQWLRRGVTQGIEWHIIAGNHDIRRSGSNYTSVLDVIKSSDLSDVYVYKQIDTIYHGLTGFTLVPFRDRKGLNSNSLAEATNRIENLLRYEAAQIPTSYNKVLIGHLAIEGSMFVGDEIDDINNELMCPLTMFSEYDYVWMGHVHKPQVLSANPHIAHIGSLDLSDFGETDHQKILILFDSKIPNNFEEIPVPSRPLRKLKISVPEFTDSTQVITEAIQQFAQTNDLSNSIMRIEATIMGGDAPHTDRNKIEELCYKTYNVYNICSFTESRQTTVVPPEKRHDMDNTIDAKSAVKRYADTLNFESEEEKQLFISESIDIINECQV